MACHREAFVQASNLAFLWIFTGLWKVVWKTLSRFILLQKGTDFLGPEGICTWRYSSQQRVMLSILQTELFQICSCLGNLHPIEPGLQPELLNHFFHSRDAGWTRYGVLERMGDPRAVGRSAVGPLGQSVGLGVRLGTLSFKFPVLYPANWFVFILGVRLCIQLSDLVLSIMHWCLLNIFRFIHIYKWKAYLFWGVWILFISYSSKRKWWFVRIQTF